MVPTVRLSGSFLSQATSPLTVVVVDPRGTPFSGAQVTLQGQSVPQKTNGSGVATFPQTPAGQAVVQVQVGDFTIRAKGSTAETLFVSVPVAAPEQILTSVEIAALLLGGAATVYGVSRKHRTAETIGEVLIGAGIFTIISRHSCRW